MTDVQWFRAKLNTHRACMATMTDDEKRAIYIARKAILTEVSNHGPEIGREALYDIACELFLQEATA